MTPRSRSLACAAAIAAAALTAAPSHSQAPATQDGVTITFLANEGVMLTAGDKKVLIDGLFVRYKGYAVPAESTQVALRDARAPFDGVDLILVTHRHGDHFHPVPVNAHLRTNFGATLVASRQVIDSLLGYAPARALPAARLLARTTPPATRRREVVNGIAVEILGLRHHDLEHNGYIVEIGGRRVLHVGDTDDAESAFPPFRLDTARIDVALLPQWMVRNEKQRRAVERWIRPRQVVAFHVGAGEGEQAARAVRAAMPAAVTFTRSLETGRW